MIDFVDGFCGCNEVTSYLFFFSFFFSFFFNTCVGGGFALVNVWRRLSIEGLLGTWQWLLS